MGRGKGHGREENLKAFCEKRVDCAPDVRAAALSSSPNTNVRCEVSVYEKKLSAESLAVDGCLY